MKEKYRDWYNSEKNDRSSSPIFKKVFTFIYLDGVFIAEGE